MIKIITLTCPTCGGKLQITNDIERFACSHCGNEHIVQRSGGVVSISPIVEELTKVKTGVDKTASELAIKRLQEEIKRLELYISNQQHWQTNMPFYGLILILLIMGFDGCLIWAGLANVFNYGIVILIIISIFIVLFGFLYLLKAHRIYKSHIEEARSQITKKKTELEKHLRIVQM